MKQSEKSPFLSLCCDILYSLEFLSFPLAFVSYQTMKMTDLTSPTSTQHAHESPSASEIERAQKAMEERAIKKPESEQKSFGLSFFFHQFICFLLCCLFCCQLQKKRRNRRNKKRTFVLISHRERRANGDSSKTRREESNVCSRLETLSIGHGLWHISRQMPLRNRSYCWWWMMTDVWFSQASEKRGFEEKQ